MTARPWPNRITRAKLASGARGFLFIPRVGELVSQSSNFVHINHFGWKAPYEDDDGNPISEDGINPGTLGEGLSVTLPQSTDDDGTTRQVARDRQGQWRVKREPQGENFRNLDWRDEDGREVLNWQGPPNRYWGFGNLIDQPRFYQPGIYRRGRLYATAPERVIGCAIHREGTLRIVVAATTAFSSALGTFAAQGTGFEFAPGKVDETNMYCRIGGGEPESEALFDLAAFEAKVAEYELAATAAARQTLRAEIETLARRWHDLALRDHEDLIDTSVPEMQDVANPRRRLGTDIWPVHFNAAGTEGQTLRRQSARAEEQLANGTDVVADVRHYRYERIKYSLTYNVEAVTVAAGTPWAFTVHILAPMVTPERIHGDRLPRLDVPAAFTVVDNSEPEPSVSAGTPASFTSLDVANTMAFNESRGGSVTAAVDYQGDTAVFAQLELAETVTADSSITGTSTRSWDELDGHWFWVNASQAVVWDSTFSRQTTVTLVHPGGSLAVTDITVSTEAASDVAKAEPHEGWEDARWGGTASWSAQTGRLSRRIDFADLRTGDLVVTETDEQVDFAAGVSESQFGSPVDYVSGDPLLTKGTPPNISRGYPHSGWEGVDAQAADIAAGLAETAFMHWLDPDGPDFPGETEELPQSARTTIRQRRFHQGPDAEALETLLDRELVNIEDEVVRAGAPRVSIYIPPFDTEPGPATGYTGFAIDGLAVPSGGDSPGIATSGESDYQSLAALQWLGEPVGNWAAGMDGDLIGSEIVTLPLDGAETEFVPVSYLTGGDLVGLNSLTVPDGQQAAFYNVAFVGV